MVERDGQIEEGCRRIVLSGGPGGGKSSLMRELRAEDPDAERYLLVPEAASLLISAGLESRTKPFQRQVVRLQIALEDAVAAAAGDCGDGAGKVLICDRGTIDSLAYWRLGGWDEQEFFDLTGMGLEDHLRRYYGVICLQTTAIGAEVHYHRGTATGRNEDLREAAEIDALCNQAWSSHPRYELIENAGRDWPAKSRAARDVLRRWLS